MAKKNVGATLALYPCPVIVVGAMVNNKPTWTLESYDFSGKTVIPFCTSGGSGVGRSDEELHKNVKGNVEWKKGTQINRPDETVIKKWLEEVL